MADDDAIEELFRGPRESFTAARDALAKSAGTAGALIKKLQKPTAPAWAVNQVYWRRRKVFDQLAKAVEQLRGSHAKRLSGKDADVGDTERAHETAVSAAADAARALLAEAGDPVTPATFSAIIDTFRAYPWPEPPGRLTRPLRPMGFEALTGLLPKGAAEKPLANIVAFDRARRERAKQRATKEEDQERAEAERRKDAATADRELRAARAELRTAEAALAKRRKALKQAESERDDLSARLDRATSRVQGIKDALGGETRRVAIATTEVNRLEERVRDLARHNR
jgi:hypothetical protein